MLLKELLTVNWGETLHCSVTWEKGLALLLTSTIKSQYVLLFVSLSVCRENL